MEIIRCLAFPALTACALLAAVAGALKTPAANDYFVYVGTYTTTPDVASGGKSGKGIYSFRWDTASGHLSSLGVAAESTNPSYLAVDPSRRHLYAVNEVADYGGAKAGGLSAFSLDRTNGKLIFLNEVQTRGEGPCYVALDQKGKYALVANYGSGSVATFPVLADGRVGDASAFVQHHGSSVNSERQTAPHAHMIAPSPGDRFVLAADLGTDELLVYRFDAPHGALAPNHPAFAKVSPGSGPRHFAFHPNGKWVYLVSEMKSTVTAFAWDAQQGALHEFQTIRTLPGDFTGKSTSAEIAVHPSGKFLYSSNRGHDSLAVFSIDQQRGSLSPVEYAPTQGRTPRNFAIDPSGKYLFAANQDSNNIVVLRINQDTGRLVPAGQVLSVPSPVAIVFVPIP